MGLTDVQIKKVKAAEKEYALLDGGGLYLRVKQNGKKFWRLNYWLQGKSMSMTLGSYPQTSLKDARNTRDEARRLLNKGIDPKTVLDQKKSAMVETSRTASEGAVEDEEKIDISEVYPHSPFRSLALAWFNHWNIGKAPAHVKRTRTRLTDNVFPILGTLPIDEIEPSNIVKMAKHVESRFAEGTDLAQRSIQTAGQIFRYGIAHSLVKRNPVPDIKPGDILKPVRTKNQARVKTPDFPALLVAIDEYKGREIVKWAAKLMVLVFLRSSEMIGGCWSEIDYHEALWRVPRERMKKLRTKGLVIEEPHLVPLSHQALELLAKCKRLKRRGSSYIFPGEFSKKGHIHGNSILEMLETLGYKGMQTGHGFRGVASTILNEQGYRSEWIDAQLAHIQKDKVSGAYNHAIYLKQRRQMMQLWADYIDKALKRGYEQREEKRQAATAAD